MYNMTKNNFINYLMNSYLSLISTSTMVSNMSPKYLKSFATNSPLKTRLKWCITWQKIVSSTTWWTPPCCCCSHVSIVANGHGKFEVLLTLTEWIDQGSRSAEVFYNYLQTRILQGTYSIFTSPWTLSIGRFTRYVIQRNDTWQWL